MENKTPWQIIVISAIDFILALASPLINILFGFAIMNKFNLHDTDFIVLLIAGTLKISLPLLFIATGIFLFKGKNWARKSQIFILILLSVISILIISAGYEPPPHSQGYLYFSVPITLICGIGIVYLLFNKKVKEYFQTN